MASKLSSFLADLKRRKVYRVAAIYAAVGVAISLAVPDLFGVLLLPVWAARLVIVLIVIGFPIALVLAWAYEVKPERPKDAEPSEKEPPVLRENLIRPAIVDLVMFGCGPWGDDFMAPLGPSESLIEQCMAAVIDYFGSAPFPHFTVVQELLRPVSERHNYNYSMEHLVSATLYLSEDRGVTSRTEPSEIERTRFNFAHHFAHAWIPKRISGRGYRPFQALSS